MQQMPEIITRFQEENERLKQQNNDLRTEIDLLKRENNEIRKMAGEAVRYVREAIDEVQRVCDLCVILALATRVHGIDENGIAQVRE